MMPIEYPRAARAGARQGSWTVRLLLVAMFAAAALSGCALRDDGRTEWVWPTLGL